MIAKILSILRKENVEKATAQDYEIVFGSQEGQRILADLMLRYRVGRPSFAFDKNGRLDIEASARSDAAKAIVSDLVDRGKLRSEEAEKPARVEDTKPLERLPSAATSI